MIYAFGAIQLLARAQSRLKKLKKVKRQTKLKNSKNSKKLKKTQIRIIQRHEEDNGGASLRFVHPLSCNSDEKNKVPFSSLAHYDSDEEPPPLVHDDSDNEFDNDTDTDIDNGNMPPSSNHNDSSEEDPPPLVHDNSDIDTDNDSNKNGQSTQHKPKQKRKHKPHDGDDIEEDDDYYDESCDYLCDYESEQESDEISTPLPREKKSMKIKDLQKQHATLANQITHADLRGRIWSQLNDCKFDKYFNNKWTMDSGNLGTLRYRVEDFIIFLHSKTISIININVVDLVTDFLRNNVSLFNEYCLQLSEVQLLSPCTVRNYSENLVKFLEWFALYRKKEKSQRLKKQVRPSKWIVILRFK